MPLKVQYPKFAYGKGMNANPGSYGSGVILAGQATATITCGELNNSSIIKIAQTESALSTVGPIIEEKFNAGGTYQRTDGLAGQFIVSTCDGSVTTVNTTFNWFVLPLGMQ